jgi:hypothetical protein
MSIPARRTDFYPLDANGLRVIYENETVKCYAKYGSFVPEGISFFLGIEFIQTQQAHLKFLFSDQVGELVFLGAVSSDHSMGLPIGLLCMSPEGFKDWLCPVNLQSAKTPRSEQFCFCPSMNFLDSSVTANQSALISNVEHYMSSLKSFVSFMVMFF